MCSFFNEAIFTKAKGQWSQSRVNFTTINNNVLCP